MQMGLIYCGERGSGKTTKLLLQANAIAKESLIPVMVACRRDFFEVLKCKADKFNIDTSDWILLTFKEALEPENRKYFQNDRYSVFIDELAVFVKEALFCSTQNKSFYATLSNENCIELKRSDWEI